MPLFHLEIDHGAAGTRRSAIVLAEDEEVALLGGGVGADESATVRQVSLLEAGGVGLRAGRMPTAAELATFFQTVHDCLRIGLVLPAALEMAAAQQNVPRLGGAIGTLLRDVRSGATLTDAIARHPDLFDAATVGLIRAGEVSGELEQTFRMLAQTAARRDRLMSQLKKSATYPVVVLVLMLAVMLYVSVTLVPSMARTYADFGAELPWITQIVITLSALIRSCGSESPAAHWCCGRHAGRSRRRWSFRTCFPRCPSWAAF
jgi:type II secretory pathway component PulF